MQLIMYLVNNRRKSRRVAQILCDTYTVDVAVYSQRLAVSPVLVAQMFDEGLKLTRGNLVLNQLTSATSKLRSSPCLGPISCRKMYPAARDERSPA